LQTRILYYLDASFIPTTCKAQKRCCFQPDTSNHIPGLDYFCSYTRHQQTVIFYDPGSVHKKSQPKSKNLKNVKSKSKQSPKDFEKSFFTTVMPQFFSIYSDNSGPDPNFKTIHSPDPIQTPENRYNPDPAQSKSSSMLISAPHQHQRRKGVQGGPWHE